MVQLSIITVVKNNAVGLRKTLESAQSQDFLDWELIIVCGSSEDGTHELASEFCALDDRIHLIEQQGQGIYDAMNLGIFESSAEFLWFMNSGDQFYSSKTLRSGLKEVRNSQSGFIVGGYQVENDQRLFQQKAGRLSKLRFSISRRGACHQAMIFRKDAVQNVGSFDLNFRIAADYKLCLQIIETFGASKVADIFAKMEPNGLSDRNLREMHTEKWTIRREIFANNPPVRVLGWWWMKAARTKVILRGLRNGKEHPFR
jgi:glycosyltransferase involved in cell wall biosynthesis